LVMRTRLSIDDVNLEAGKDVGLLRDLHPVGSNSGSTAFVTVFKTIPAAVAEMERYLLLERTKAGLARARAEGKTLGRPRKTTRRRAWPSWHPIRPARQSARLSRAYGVSRATVSSSLKQDVPA
jgi:DNA invertase Pin-like site-specific DNA recombinase